MHSDPLSDLDPAKTEARDAQHFRRIIEARKGVEQAEAELRDAVAAAREAGDSWTVIGAALGVHPLHAKAVYGREATLSLQEVIDRQDEIADRFEND